MSDVGKLVSVIVPVYQAEAYLADCIESILKQTYGNMEIILVDDGSEDGSGKLCDRYADQYSNVFCIHQRNRGVSTARNRGIDRAKGEYILFVDSDDYIAPDYLEKAIMILDSEDADMYLCGYQNVSRSGKAKKETYFPGISEGIWMMYNLDGNILKPFCSCTLHAIGTKIYKRRIIEKHGIRFKTAWKLYEDVCFCLDYLAYCNTIYVQNKIMYYYRRDVPNSLSQLNYEYICMHKTFCMLYRLAGAERMCKKDEALFYKMYLGNINLCINVAISIEKRYSNKICRLYRMAARDTFYREALAYAEKNEKIEYFLVERKLFFWAYMVRKYLLGD